MKLAFTFDLKWEIRFLSFFLLNFNKRTREIMLYWRILFLSIRIMER